MKRNYPQPGVYSEILKVTDKTGNVDYDFAEVHVLDPKNLAEYVPRIHASYWPSLSNRVGEPITFKVRTFGNTSGEEVWDFGDGSPNVSVKSDGNVKPLNEEGYAVTQHTYQKPGDYLVKVERSREDGVTATTRLHIRVEPLKLIVGATLCGCPRYRSGLCDDVRNSFTSAFASVIWNCTQTGGWVHSPIPCIVTGLQTRFPDHC